jgi:hypothetical protein
MSNSRDGHDGVLPSVAAADGARIIRLGATTAVPTIEVRQS